MKVKLMSSEERQKISEAIRQHILNSPSHKIYRRKIALISEIKRFYGDDCIDNSTKNFSKQNMVIFKKNITGVILYFHFSNEIGFFGSDVGHVNHIANYITDNASKRIYAFIYLMLDNLEIRKVNFALPVFFVKNHESEISKSKYKGSIPPQYKFNVIFRNGKYWLRLKNNQLEDISIFQTSIKDLLNQSLINRYEEEKEKYSSISKDKQELLKKLVK